MPSLLIRCLALMFAVLLLTEALPLQPQEFSVTADPATLGPIPDGAGRPR